MITLDASVVIAHLSPHHPHHKAAGEYLRGSAAEDLVIHSLNLAEVLVGGVKAGPGHEMLADLEAIGLASLIGRTVSHCDWRTCGPVPD